MDRIKKLKIKKQDGTFSDYIPIGADAENIDTTDGESVQLKLNKKPYYYNSVADMKADTKLKAGDMAITLGYYTANDGGGAEYKIVTSSEKYYEELNNQLLAELIIRNIMNPCMFGAKHDSISDDSAAIQYAIDSGCSIVDGLNYNYITSNYKKSSTVNYGIIISNSITIKNMKMKLKDNCPNYTCLLIADLKKEDNVKLINLFLDGNNENQSQTGTVSQDGGFHGVRLLANGTLIIENTIICNCYTDGIATIASDNATIICKNVEIYNAGRNGITHNGYDGFFENIYIHNNGYRTLPKNGFHIEADFYNTMNNIIINNSILTDNTNDDFHIYLNKSGHYIRQIKIDNCKIGAIRIYPRTPESEEYLNIIDNLIINNSIINEPCLLSAGTATEEAIQNILINNCIFNSEIRIPGYINHIKIAESKLIRLELYKDINSLELEGCIFQNEEMPDGDNQLYTSIIAKEILNVKKCIIDKCYFDNQSRGIRLSTIETLNVSNCYFNTSTHCISITSIGNICICTNNIGKAKYYFLTSGNAGTVICTNNDVRGCSSSYINNLLTGVIESNLTENDSI